MSMLPFLIFCTSLTVVTARHYASINEQWVCSVKQTCFDCLILPHCSWCNTESKCYSSKIVNLKDFCPNGTINHDPNYGLSLEENADCSCADGKKHLHCYPAGTTDGPECSGRGECRCGHCICDPSPDSRNPTKRMEKTKYNNQMKIDTKVSCRDFDTSKKSRLQNVAYICQSSYKEETKDTSLVKPFGLQEAIMGEYCEFDNFSCDGPKCNEGPYSISQPVVADGDDDGKTPDDIDDVTR